MHNKLLLLFITFLISQQVCISQIANRVFTNAKVYKGDGIFHEAIAIKDGKIIYTGTTAGAAIHINSSTCVKDVDGKLILPGLHDVHMHPLEASSSAGGNCVLDDTITNVTTLKNLLIACNMQLNPNGWKMASGHTVYALLNHPNPKLVLDSIDNVNPILVMEKTSHSIWVNSVALALAGITSSTPDPIGGVIRHTSTGEPNGVLMDNAGDNLIQIALANNATLSTANYNGLINYGLPTIAENGITSISEARTYWKRNYIQTWQQVKNNGLLTCRVALAPWLYPSDNDATQIPAIQALYSNGDSLMKIRQIKVYADGIIHNATAALSAPYDDSLGLPFGNGLNYFTETRLSNYITQLELNGYDFHIHAIGDRGITESLNAIQTARTVNGNIGARHRVTHVEMVNPTDFPRFNTLNVVADMQVAGDFTQPANWSENAPLIGAARSNNWVPLKSIKNANAKITLSSDWDVSTINPFIGMTNALTRVPQELSSVDDVVKAYTINGAYVMRQEAYTGSLDTGKFADLIVVDQDIFTIAPDSIYKTKVLLTLLSGNQVYVSPTATNISCLGAVLPITLSSFTAKLIDQNSSLISWETNSELFADHFEIERSIDAIHFEKIGEVAANNNKHYLYNDIYLPNFDLIYYRLKTFDKDQSISLSKIAAVKKNVSNSLKIFPNPAIDNFIITDIIENANLEIVDMTGRVVKRVNNVSSGSRVNISDLNEGKYCVKLLDQRDDDFIKAGTLIKN